MVGPLPSALTWRPLEVWVVAGDREELLEHGFIEVTIWLGSSVVRHEVDDEVVGSRRHETGEGSREEVWVGVDAFGHLLIEVLSPSIEGVSVWAGGGIVGADVSLHVEAESIAVLHKR